MPKIAKVRILRRFSTTSGIATVNEIIKKFGNAKISKTD